ncbi:MAG: hypothetical protein WEB53_09715 [Akkermansiaceae bacterium]
MGSFVECFQAVGIDKPHIGHRFGCGFLIVDDPGPLGVVEDLTDYEG